MSQPASPRQVVEALMQGIEKQQWLELHGLYAEEAIVEYPFALPLPRRLEGREAIQRYFAMAAAAPLQREVWNMVVYETTDPEVVVAEWDYDGLVNTTGRRFRVSNIQVTRVRNGKSVASRDYHNHTMMAHVMGQLTSLVTALAGNETP